MTMTKEQYAQNIKKGNAVEVKQADAIAGHWLIIEEFLNAAQGVLIDFLNIAEGDVNVLYESERGLFEVYASWDHFNKGDRKTSDELVAQAKENT